MSEAGAIGKCGSLYRRDRAVRTRDLAREMKSAVAAMTSRDVAHLVHLGVPEILVERHQMVGLARVREDRCGFYEPDPDGRWAYITPICVHFVKTPETPRPNAAWFCGNLVDLVAWDERTPEHWRLRVGSATWLGAIGPQYMDPDPVPVWRSPLRWLQNDCVGLVPLVRNRTEAFQLLSVCVGDILAEDDEHAARIADALEHPYRRPSVFANRGLRHAA